jgi:hypothetical protein
MQLLTAQQLFDVVMGGGSAEELRPQVYSLPFEERDQLLSALHFIRNEVAANCQARAEEIDRLLDSQPT